MKHESSWTIAGHRLAELLCSSGETYIPQVSV